MPRPHLGKRTEGKVESKGKGSFLGRRRRLNGAGQAKGTQHSQVRLACESLLKSLCAFCFFFANKQTAHTLRTHTQTSCKSNRSKGNKKNKYNNNGHVKLNNSHGSEFFTIFAFCRRHRESLWLRKAEKGMGRERKREAGSMCAAIAWLVDSACFSPILLKRKI